MAAGLCGGAIYNWDAERRRKWLLVAGRAVNVLFVPSDVLNVYGDPVPWTAEHNAFLSFLNTTKYPPSLLFLLMTLGPALIVPALADRLDGKAIWQRIAVTFGGVPMFYYLLQMPVAHAFGIVLSLATGKDIAYFFMNFPQMAWSCRRSRLFAVVVYAA